MSVHRRLKKASIKSMMRRVASSIDLMELEDEMECFGCEEVKKRHEFTDEAWNWPFPLCRDCQMEAEIDMEDPETDRQMAELFEAGYDPIYGTMPEEKH